MVDVEADFALRAAKGDLLEPPDFKTIDHTKIDPPPVSAAVSSQPRRYWY